MANPTTNFGWVMPTSTDLVTDLPADFAVFGQGVDTSLQYLNGGTTGQVLSKTSNANLAFTWVTTDDTNAIQNSIVDAKGDLIGATGADTPARLAVGTNGQFLSADSTAATGLAWATPTSGGMTLINAGGTALTGASVVIGSIPATYKHLLIVVNSMFISAASDSVYLRLNGDTGSNYTNGYVRQIAGTLTGQGGTSGSFIEPFPRVNTSTARLSSNGAIWIYQYTQNDSVGITFQTAGSEGSSVTTAQGACTYDNSAAISSITLYCPGAFTFTAGTIYVYGVN
jgi:hypothetical protein